LIKHIPNVVTLLNLFCGSIAVLFAVNGNMKLTAIFVFLGVFFDFFDGLLARKLNVQSELGLQLDSLADMITSGLVTGLVMFHLLSSTLTDFSLINTSSQWTESFSWISFKINPLPFFGLLITLASAYRLAKFNIDDNQADSFIGLPTPANTLFILSLPLIVEFQNNDTITTIIQNKWFLIGVTLLSAFLLNANIKLLALKFKTWSIKDNVARYLLILLSILALMLFQFAGIPIIIILYILISLFKK